MYTLDNTEKGVKITFDFGAFEVYNFTFDEVDECVLHYEYDTAVEVTETQLNTLSIVVQDLIEKALKSAIEQTAVSSVG